VRLLTLLARHDIAAVGCHPAQGLRSQLLQIIANRLE